MNILVTGATGAIGAHLARSLVQEDHNVISILHDIRPIDSAKALGIFDEVTWIQGDVTNENLVKRIVADYDVEEVYHLAALPIVKTGLRVFVPVYQANIMGTLMVLEAIRDQKNAGYNVKMLYLSTDKVYGYGNQQRDRRVVGRDSTIRDVAEPGKVHGGFREEDCISGMAPYENSKSCADLICQGYARTFGLDIRIVRSCNVYGPADFNSRIVPNTIRRLLAGKHALIWRGVTYVREYIYATDLVSAMKLVMESGKAEDIFNVGSGVLRTQDEVIREIMKHFEKGAVQEADPPPYTHYEIQYQALDHTKISEALHWHPAIAFDAGIKMTVEWWRAWKSAKGAVSAHTL